MILTLLTVAQVGMSITGLVILLEGRRTIWPKDAWWSFAIREILWIVLGLDNLLTLFGRSLIEDAVSMAIQVVIVGILLYALYKRYRLQQKITEERQDFTTRIEELEKLRNGRGGGW